MNNAGSHLTSTTLHGSETNESSPHLPSYPAHELDYISELIDLGAKNSFYGDENKELYAITEVDQLLELGAHPIALLDTINNSSYGGAYSILENADTYLDHGVTPAELLQKIDKTKLEPKDHHLYDDFLLKLLRAGGDSSVILHELDDGFAYAAKDELLAMGVDPQQVFDAADYRKLRYAKEFEELGVHIDGQNIADSLEDGYKAQYFDVLTKYGASIDVQALLDRSKNDAYGFSTANILSVLGSLKEAAPEVDFQAYVDAQRASQRARFGLHLREQGIAIDGQQLLGEMIDNDEYLHENTITELLALGANPDEIYSHYRGTNSHDATGHLKPFIEAGITLHDIDRFVRKMGSDTIAYNLTDLTAVGAHININRLASKLTDQALNDTIALLIENGLRINDDRYVEHLETKVLEANFDILVGAGIETSILEQRIKDGEEAKAQAQKRTAALSKAARSLDF